MAELTPDPRGLSLGCSLQALEQDLTAETFKSWALRAKF